MITVKTSRTPRGPLARAAFPRPDYADCYAADLPTGPCPTVDDLARAFFQSAPDWVDTLMRLRDRAVGWVGLKTSGVRRPDSEELAFEPGAKLGIFRVFERSANEILLGENDRHLDFRVSLLSQRAERSCRVSISTVVRFNSDFGRLYFLPVRPLHGLIVRAMLRRTLRLLQEKQAER